ncbi:MAG: TonB family protein [Holophagaceae bacterium]|nr:TonB family protein [Holophagaceae bacterium]
MSPDPANIGRYQIQGLLGRGGMGAVYLALDPLLKRQVVIKVVHEKGASYDHALERFQREAEISARLNHPNVITIHDVGTDPVMGPFIAMEYVKGQSLATMIRAQGPPPVDQVLRIIAQASRALHAAAGEGIVHRDVKPENILVSPEGRVKLTDFGIAKLGESNLTTVGGVVGTPSYIAPELLRDAVASAVTDCYALAVTAFESITGDLPFKGESVASMLLRIVHEPPAIPKTLSPALAGVFCKAFEKRPEDRFPDVNSFTAALIHAVPLGSSFRTKLLLMLAGEDVSLHGFVAVSTNQWALPEGQGTPAPPPTPPPQPRPALAAAPEPPRRPVPAPALTPTPAVPRPREPDTSAPTALKPPLPPPPASALAAAPAPAGVQSSSGPARGLLVAGLLGTLTFGMVGAGAWALKRRQVAAAPAVTVSVVTEPSGAVVKLDGEAKGTAPVVDLRLKPEGQLLRVELPGYLAQELTVKPGDGEVRLTLQPETPAAGAAAGTSGGPEDETERLQKELRRLKELNAREEQRLRQTGKPVPAPNPATSPATSASAPVPVPVTPPAAAVPAPPVPANRAAAVLRQAAAAYPPQALGNSLFTLRAPRVRLRVFVNENGVPLQVVVADGVGKLGFDEAAMAAARRSTYAPAIQNGRAMAAWVELTFQFQAPR